MVKVLNESSYSHIFCAGLSQTAYDYDALCDGDWTEKRELVFEETER